MKTSEIKFTVTLDEEKIPQSIQWEAGDSGIEGKKDCKATMLTVWDAKDNTTLRIDLWTKEMLIDDMKRFFYENLMTMADTYLRATNDASLSREMKKFADEFAKQAELFNTAK
jgi:gliding motility-associated protein GldC